ncbi:sulfatase family protein [Haloferula sp.]|uniref:sulfatase family protein n=1 Tax=Haloferula sp. TaxID=2497595 RepID=UPI003C744B92
MSDSSCLPGKALRCSAFVNRGSEQKQTGIAWRVALGVLLFLGWNYASGLWRLANQSGGMETKFSRLAVEEHRAYLIGQNLLVLVAYAILGVVAWLIVMPLVSEWRKRWKRELGWREVAVALGGCILIHGYFMFRLIHSRPYFTGDATFGDWYYQILEWPPEVLQPVINGFLFVALPWIAGALVCFWWWKRSGKPGRAVMLLLLIVGLVVSVWKPSRGEAATIEEGSEKPMNVLIIGSDSLRGDRLGFAGYTPERKDGEAAGGVSPSIDAWARDAIVFDQCRTSMGSTLESSISMMSSTYPHSHGIRQMFASREEVDAMNQRVIPLAKLLADKGYDTAALGDWCAGFYELAPLGFEEIEVSSFDSFRIYMSQAVFLSHFVVPLYFDNAVGYRLFPQIRSFAQFVTPDVVTERVEERLAEQASSGRPFFWHVFYSSNHLPYRAAEPYCRMFSDPNYSGKNATGVDFDIDQFIGGTDVEDKWSALPEVEVRQIGALYDGCTRQFDDCFRRIIEALDAHGLKDNTIVVLTADHGDDLYEPRVTLGHGLSFNGAGHSFHVPLAFHVPGRGALRFDEQVRTLDIAPTLADLTGVEVPPEWEGRSLVPWMDDPEAAEELPFYGETQFPFIQLKVEGIERPHLPPMDELTLIDPDFNFQFVLKEEYREKVLAAKQYCLRARGWKLVCTPTAEGTRHFELFDTKTDPNCLQEISAKHPALLHPMIRALERWIDEQEETPVSEIFADGVASSRSGGSD